MVSKERQSNLHLWASKEDIKESRSSPDDDNMRFSQNGDLIPLLVSELGEPTTTGVWNVSLS